jgi:hypothetical protein
MALGSRPPKKIIVEEWDMSKEPSRENALAADFLEGFPGQITLTDKDGVILRMNSSARAAFAESGDLIGSNVLDCHPEPSRSLLAGLMKDEKNNAYLVEKAGKCKMVYQFPWYRDGRYAGFAEISFPVPSPLPVKHRRPKGGETSSDAPAS